MQYLENTVLDNVMPVFLFLTSFRYVFCIRVFVFIVLSVRFYNK